jgi:hypothetical protein
MCRTRDRVLSALVALLVQIILVVACFAASYVPESSTVEGVPVLPSAQGVAEPV